MAKQYAHPSQRAKRSARKLRPAGHSAAIEALIQPAIVVGSTLMSAIAAYVLALDDITRILTLGLDRPNAPADLFVVALCAGMGFLIDMAIIVSATRYKMHAVRDDPRERRWLQLAKWVLVVGLTSEAMTLFYFFVHLDPAAFPSYLVALADWIHSVLAVSRAFLPPVVIAYFAAGVLPVMFDRADRNREIKSRTSSNIMLLIDRLSEVFDTDDKAEMLRALGGQLMLDTYATYDETARTTEDQQLRRDAKLLAHLARIHRLDWSAIAADVAPALAPDSAQLALSTPQGLIEGQPQGKRKEEEQGQEGQEQQEGQEGQQQRQPIPLRTPATSPAPAPAIERKPAPALAPAASARPAARPAARSAAQAERRATQAERIVVESPARQEERVALRQRREEAARRILDEQPDITNTRLAQLIAIATRNRISDSTARAIREQVMEQLAVDPATERATEQRPPLHIITPAIAPAINPINPANSAREEREN